MKNLKFRAWDKKRKEFTKEISISVGGYISTYNGSDSYDIELMQFTGLLDKNGKEIYEGDIIKVLDRDWSDMEKDTKYREVVYEAPSFILKDHHYSLYREYGRDRFEIIGNIYENGDLLTPKK